MKVLGFAGTWGVFALDVSRTPTAMLLSCNFSKMRMVCQVKTDKR